jgi:hypothetical protein
MLPTPWSTPWTDREQFDIFLFFWWVGTGSIQAKETALTLVRSWSLQAPQRSEKHKSITIDGGASS